MEDNILTQNKYTVRKSYYKVDELSIKNPTILSLNNLADKVLKCETVYIIQFDNGIKVGKSKNFKNRLLAYTKPWSREIRNILVFKLTGVYDIMSTVECELIKKFKSDINRNSSEFITNIDNINVIETARKIIKNSYYYVSGRSKQKIQKDLKIMKKKDTDRLNNWYLTEKKKQTQGLD